MIDSSVVPAVTPENFELIPGSINSTSASFGWRSVDESPAAVRGFFRGYQVGLLILS